MRTATSDPPRPVPPVVGGNRWTGRHGLRVGGRVPYPNQTRIAQLVWGAPSRWPSGFSPYRPHTHQAHPAPTPLYRFYYNFTLLDSSRPLRAHFRQNAFHGIRPRACWDKPYATRHWPPPWMHVTMPPMGTYKPGTFFILGCHRPVPGMKMYLGRLCPSVLYTAKPTTNRYSTVR